MEALKNSIENKNKKKINKFQSAIIMTDTEKRLEKFRRQSRKMQTIQMFQPSTNKISLAESESPSMPYLKIKTKLMKENLYSQHQASLDRLETALDL